MVVDIDRMGALAPYTSPRSPAGVIPSTQLPEEVNGYFAEMGRIAVKLGQQRARGAVDARPEEEGRGASAEKTTRMDDLHRHLFTVLMDREWKHGTATAVDVTAACGRYYERFADHAGPNSHIRSSSSTNRSVLRR